MAYFHQRIRIPNPIITLYYAKLFLLVQIWIQIPVRIVSQMVTAPILGTDIQPRDRSPFLYHRFESESKSEPVEKSCTVQESESESISGSGNKP